MLDVPGQPSATRAIDLPRPERTQPGALPDVRWSDDGSRILVSRPVDARAWPLLDAARPDIGAMLVIGGLVLLAAGIARVVGRPRVPGRSYCRRCNHDLNAGPGARPSSDRCPECGLSLGARAIARGATRARRLARVLVPSLAALGLGAWLFTASVRGAGARATSIGIAWPIAAASQVAGWPWMRTSTIDTPSRPARRIDVIRVEPDALVLESPCIIDAFSPNPLASADGTVIAWVEHSFTTGWVPTLHWFDATTSRSGSVGIAPAHAGFPSLCGWTPDGREVVALVQRTDVDYDRRDDGTAIFEVDVVAVDPRTGAVRPAGRGRGRATGGGSPSQGWNLGPAIAAIGAGPSPRTVTVTAEQAGASRGAARGELVLRELTVSEGTESRVVPLGDVGVEGVSEFRRAWLRPDGRLGVEFSSPFSYGNP
ncbi:MAG: hypothetical protein FGM39_08695, partial [Phycisphaerales bacterium]|nr:hypothetical protein [Phycisphaerales bacterium]